jgi:outer membrane receptor protein involved in Fe transport
VGQLLSPRPWLTFDADVSWSSSRFTDGDPVGSAIPGAVGHVASIGASIAELRRFSGSLRLRHLAPRPLVEDASVHSERPLIVNLQVGYRLAPNARLVVDILNLLDSQDSDVDYFYRSRLSGEPAEGVDDVHTHPVQPRTARISVRLDF